MLRRRAEDLTSARGLLSAANKRCDKLEAMRRQHHAAQTIQAANAKEPKRDRVQQRIRDVEMNLTARRLQETKENLCFRHFKRIIGVLELASIYVTKQGSGVKFPYLDFCRVFSPSETPYKSTSVCVWYKVCVCSRHAMQLNNEIICRFYTPPLV